MASAGLTIAEVADCTGLTRHTLRYYERDGLMLSVDRDDSGHRRYSELDLGWIELITKLRATGMPVREVRRYAELVRAGDGNEAERLALLRAHRDRVSVQLDTMA
ncbi:MAG: MerR family transcriptional regulator, partial [Trebonia sp.]